MSSPTVLYVLKQFMLHEGQVGGYRFTRRSWPWFLCRSCIIKLEGVA
ncbi:hypothetical protein OL548_02710 [Lysinibacillus sp. MHQ-1]|nr:hypothetical protein OL548_02710 [Lysinibacillus sp. MHQ-1]